MPEISRQELVAFFFHGIRINPKTNRHERAKNKKLAIYPLLRTASFCGGVLLDVVAREDSDPHGLAG
jgi:hypothetical protein